MLLHYTDTEYEDTVWEVTKRDVWMDAKSKNDFHLDFPNLPYWIDGDLKLTQSTAIMRHLARKNGLYGLTDAHASEIGTYSFRMIYSLKTMYIFWRLIMESNLFFIIDMLIDTAMDLKMGLIKVVMGDFVS